MGFAGDLVGAPGVAETVVRIQQRGSLFPSLDEFLVGLDKGMDQALRQFPQLVGGWWLFRNMPKKVAPGEAAKPKAAPAPVRPNPPVPVAPAERAAPAVPRPPGEPPRLQLPPEQPKLPDLRPKPAGLLEHKPPGKHVRDPNWTHTWRKGRAGAAHNADTLRKKMGLKPTAMEDGLDAHHIVQSTNNKIPEFQKARDLLLEHQIDINSAANGVALRTTKPGAPLPADPTLRMHKGGELHTNEGGRRTYQRLQDAVDRAGSDWGARRQALLDELAKMREEIKAGTFP